MEGRLGLACRIALHGCLPRPLRLAYPLRLGMARLLRDSFGDTALPVMLIGLGLVTSRLRLRGVTTRRARMRADIFALFGLRIVLAWGVIATAPSTAASAPTTAAGSVLATALAAADR